MSDKAQGSEKAQAKFQALWIDYVEARKKRQEAMAGEWPDESGSWVALALSATGDDAVSLLVEVMQAERKALKRLAKHVRRHGRDVLSPDQLTQPPSRVRKTLRSGPSEAAGSRTGRAGPRVAKRAQAPRGTPEATEAEAHAGVRRGRRKAPGTAASSPESPVATGPAAAGRTRTRRTAATPRPPSGASGGSASPPSRTRTPRSAKASASGQAPGTSVSSEAPSRSTKRRRAGPAAEAKSSTSAAERAAQAPHEAGAPSSARRGRHPRAGGPGGRPRGPKPA